MSDVTNGQKITLSDYLKINARAEAAEAELAAVDLALGECAEDSERGRMICKWICDCHARDEELEALRRDGSFLINRLRDFENEELIDVQHRAWIGHIQPAMARVLAGVVGPTLQAASPTPTDAQPKAASHVGDEALAVPKGWKIVPDYMTDDMVVAVNGVRRDSVGYATRAYMARHDYNKALAAAPSTALATHPTTGQETVARSAERFLSDPAVKAQIRQNAAEMRALKETVATPRDGGVAAALIWRATCGVCESAWKAEQPDTPSKSGTFCPDCRERGLMAPGVLHWKVDAALSAPGSIGPGEVVTVPREPTEAMLNAPLAPGSSITNARYESRRDLRPLIYKAMIGAATPSPAQEPGTGDTGEHHSVFDREQSELANRYPGLATPATTAETRGPADRECGR